MVHDIPEKIQSTYKFGIGFNKLMDLNSNLAESFFTLRPVVLTSPPKVPDWHGLMQLLSARKEVLSLKYCWLWKMSENIN